MTTTMQLGHQRIQVTAQPLTQEAFAPFGSVIANPRPALHPSATSSRADDLPADAAPANQGSAIQYRHVSRIRSLYDRSPSGAAEPIMSLFVCAARELSPAGVLALRVLERHPFTTQTFSPLSSSAAAYLVVVAPSMPPGEPDALLPAPEGEGLPGRGLPDVPRLRAFVASPAQAVTYGAGTWHAPMAALGASGTTLDFVVSQYASGVAVEDCQEVELHGVVEVRVPGGGVGGRSAKL